MRTVQRVVTAHRQEEGGGFIVRRPFPTAGLPLVDPFLLLDEMGPVVYGPGEAIGAPDHPHRGFETVTYVLDGEMEHEDSAGHRGALGPGDVQWMTAGDGVVHAEMPSARVQREGGRVHGFQIWVNLPRKWKRVPPRYQEYTAAKIPAAATPDGRARVKVVAGEALGVRGAVETRIPIAYQDWTLDPGAVAEVPAPRGLTALAYLFSGTARVAGQELHEGQMALLADDGEAVRLEGAGDGPARLLFLAGQPIGEPVARYGPFVMNTPDEIRQAIVDFQSGRMGDIRR